MQRAPGNGVLGADDKVVVARIWRQDRTLPADRKFIIFRAARNRRRRTEVEVDLLVDALIDLVVGTEAASLVELGLEALPRIDFALESPKRYTSIVSRPNARAARRHPTPSPA